MFRCGSEGRRPIHTADKMKKRYLVCGGAGFIGSNYVSLLASQSAGERPEIVVLDALTYAGNPAWIARETASGAARLIHGNICDEALVSGILEEFRPDYIVNFAAETHVDRSIDNPKPFVDSNIAGAQTLLECARRLRLGEKKGSESLKMFVQIGTDEVYGHLPLDYPEGRDTATPMGYSTKAYGRGVFTESTPLSPSSPYSASKAAADFMALAYFRTFGLPVCVTRCSNNYGPRQYPEKLIPLMVTNLMKGEKLPVYGRGLNVRDWLYVGDHCRAIEAVIAGGKPGEVYNIGGFNERRNIDIVRQLIAIVRRLVADNPRYREASALPVEKIDDSMIAYVTDRPGHDSRYAIDSSKLVAATGWCPLTDFETGLEATVKSILDEMCNTENPEGK